MNKRRKRTTEADTLMTGRRSVGELELQEDEEAPVMRGRDAGERWRSERKKTCCKTKKMWRSRKEGREEASMCPGPDKGSD